MPALIGVLLALGVALSARVIGFDRDRSFYPTVLIVIASYYVLFAVMGPADLTAEIAGFLFFAAAAAVGFRTNLWIVAGALAVHGLFDFFHDSWLANPAVPRWWPGFCLGFDLAAAASLAVLLAREQRKERAASA